jgi:hypothetical protein
VKADAMRIGECIHTLSHMVDARDNVLRVMPMYQLTLSMYDSHLSDKIQRIKCFRKYTGCGLKESKRYIDRLMDYQTVKIGPVSQLFEFTHEMHDHGIQVEILALSQ